MFNNNFSESGSLKNKVHRTGSESNIYSPPRFNMIEISCVLDAY